MKMINTIRSSFALIAALAFLAGCDPARPVNHRYDELSPTLFTFEENLLGRYGSEGRFSVHGMIDDEGKVETQFLSWTEHGALERILGIKTLTGRHGTIVLEFEGHVVNEGKHVEGTFRIVEGTGDYENLSGEGSFEMSIDIMPGTSAMRGILQVQ